MGFIVKNTTKCGVLDLICPHSCRGCGQLGSVLCECCKKNLFREQGSICPLCKQMVAKSSKNDGIGKCPDCDLPFEGVVVGGWRTGALDKLVKEYKYQGVRAAETVLVELLDRSVPKTWPQGAETVNIVPLPTIGRHVRERGIDHTLRLAKLLAKRRGWRVRKILRRAADTVQVGTKMTDRAAQAKRAYELAGEVQGDEIYALLDDIWTTGASMLAAANVMREAGVRRMVAMVVATGKAREISDE